MKFGRDDYNRRIVDLENKIPEDEPVFLLRAQDKLSPRLLLMWATELRLKGGDPNMAREAEDHAQAMIQWQNEHKCKTPDMYRESAQKQFIKEKINILLSEIASGKRINVSELSDWIEKYYDKKDLVSILMHFDLKDEFKDISEDSLQYNHFNLSDEDELKLYNSKLAIYCSNRGPYRILMNKL